MSETASTVFAFWFARTWARFRGARWRIVIEAALAPLSLVLVAASAYVVTRAAGHTPGAVGITVATALATRVNPLWLFAAAGHLGLAGLV